MVANNETDSVEWKGNLGMKGSDRERRVTGGKDTDVIRNINMYIYIHLLMFPDGCT